MIARFFYGPKEENSNFKEIPNEISLIENNFTDITDLSYIVLNFKCPAAVPHSLNFFKWCAFRDRIKVRSAGIYERNFSLVCLLRK